jgi:hypothetical protein
MDETERCKRGEKERRAKEKRATSKSVLLRMKGGKEREWKKSRNGESSFGVSGETCPYQVGPRELSLACTVRP